MESGVFALKHKGIGKAELSQRWRELPVAEKQAYKQEWVDWKAAYDASCESAEVGLSDK